MSFQNKFALVTGGAGALGSAVVMALLDAGALVDVPAFHSDEQTRLQSGLNATQRSRLSSDILDLTDEAAVHAYYTALAERHGGIDLVVNIAGGFDGGKPVHASDWSVWQGQLDMNLKTAVLSCQAAIPHMFGRAGAIVNVSSRTATQAGGTLAAYAASKRAILQLTEALAAELRDQGITANAILPGVIDTPANRNNMPDADHARWVAPAAIAQVVLFLLGPDARIISGAAIPVYGRS